MRPRQHRGLQCLPKWVEMTYVTPLKFFSLVCGLACLSFSIPAAAKSEAIVLPSAISSAHPLATAAGIEILRLGGNAFDAAVTVSAVLAVVEPYNSGLGGGGFWLLHSARDNKDIMLDARETAPLAATPDMFMDNAGNLRPRRSLDGALAAAIPGTPAGLVWLSKKYGKLPLPVVLAPAVKVARFGFPVDEPFIRMVGLRQSALKQSSFASRQFLLKDQVPEVHVNLAQPQLALTLERLGTAGSDGFYKGRWARHMVQVVKVAGGIWSVADLERYRVKERQPITISYRGATITTAALPSSGGLVLAQSLNILEQLNYHDAPPVQKMHYVAEALRRAYHDRFRYMGDADFVDVPSARLTAKSYAASRAVTIQPDDATASESLSAPSKIEGQSTTHFSVADKYGNRVAATLSINTPFGSAFVAGDTGVLLNNEMDDFSVAPGVANTYGLLGNAANAIAPGKRPLSSMSPTFVEDERGILVVGTPGGSRIISMVLLAVLDYMHNPQVDLNRMVSAPRYHHQYLPDRIELEPQVFSEVLSDELQLKGHAVEVAARAWGNMQVLYIDKNTGRISTASDPRGHGRGEILYH